MVYELLSHQINSVLAAKVSSLLCEPVLNRCDVIVLLHADTTDRLMGKNVRCDVNWRRVQLLKDQHLMSHNTPKKSKSV